MKLLQHTGKSFLLASAVMFLIAAFVAYFAIRTIVNYDTDESLLDAREDFIATLKIQDAVPERVRLLDNIVFVEPIHNARGHREMFADTIIEDPLDDGDLEQFRCYRFIENIDGKQYAITLLTSKLEGYELVKNIALAILALLGVMLTALFFVQRNMSKKIWRPFHQTLRDLKTFSFKYANPMRPGDTGIEEFDELNSAAFTMKSKIVRDYHNLKQFTENASHEMQTPLSVIQSHAELLLQQSGLDSATAQYAYIIQSKASKLAKLNASLLMLTQMESTRYAGRERIQIMPLIERKIEYLAPLFEAKGIKVDTRLEAHAVLAHPDLVDSLFTNLVGNAIKHNHPDGEIRIVLSNVHFEIRNTGDPLKRHPDELFERFATDRDDGSSTGLGLAISQEVCDQYGWKLHYHFEIPFHIVQVQWK